MAIKTIKEVIDSKGYVINSKDRAIFETGDLRSFFGISSSDAIEFIVYDINDNQLPQGTEGSLVRYIPLTTQNISDYILIPEGTILQKYSLPSEYFIDVERLLRESGYNNGLFKTQITLINKRAGSEMKDDKLYINEISPSRTEVRLFPVLKSSSDAVKSNLKERFGIFLNDGTFRDDVISVAISYIEKINPSNISGLLTSKYGDAWLENFKKEYKVSDFDLFITEIYNKFLQSCVYEFTDRISDINDLNYGKTTGIQPPLSLDKSEINKKINKLLVAAIDKYLIVPETRNTQRNIENIESKDNIEKILIKKESDLVIDTAPPIKQVKILNKPILKDKEVSFKEKVKKQIPKPLISDDILEPIPLPKSPDGIPVINRGSGGGSGGGSSITSGETYVRREVTEPFRPEVVDSPKTREALK